MGRGAWRATVHGVAKRQPQLSSRARMVNSWEVKILPFRILSERNAWMRCFCNGACEWSGQLLAEPVLEFPSWKRTRLRLKCLTTEMRVMEPALTACWGVWEIKVGSCVLNCFLIQVTKMLKNENIRILQRCCPLFKRGNEGTVGTSLVVRG